MSILVLDGPEKAGKSTLIRWMQEVEPSITVRKWYQPSGYEEYEDALQEDIILPYVVWDRAWPSDAVYSSLMPQATRRFVADPEAAEAILGTTLRAHGFGVILAGPGASELRARRTSDDLPVDPALEQRAYLDYALKFGWTVHREATRLLAHTLVYDLRRLAIFASC